MNRAPGRPDDQWGAPRSKTVSWHDPAGTLHGGLLCTLLDFAATTSLAAVRP